MNETRYKELALSPDARLEEIFKKSSGPALDSLAGWEWRGFNTPRLLALLGIRKFIKGFFEADSGIEGYNVPVRQNGLDGPWLHKPSAQAPKRFGFYRVGTADAGPLGETYPRAVFLNYGASPRNAPWKPERVLRDYLVQPDPAEPDILLGKAYLALGPLRVPSNFFILGRLRPACWRP